MQVGDLGLGQAIGILVCVFWRTVILVVRGRTMPVLALSGSLVEAGVTFIAVVVGLSSALTFIIVIHVMVFVVSIGSCGALARLSLLEAPLQWNLRVHERLVHEACISYIVAWTTSVNH